ncbi:MAG: hypothetical protein HY941_09450 [Gammaproteobacteria bacterium]|nr:hypothetical protein [Gammaproteobacteria bacterium]
MNTDHPPHFLDFEASGLGVLGFPIEVAWGNVDGVMECWLIRPDARWHLEVGWEPVAEGIHGIRREQLAEAGADTVWIAERMNAQLAGAVVYVDGLPYDRLWLEQLFQSAGITPTFELANFDELLYAVAPPTQTYRRGWMEQLRAVAVGRLKGLHWHRADNDVRRLIEMYRIAAARR